MASAKLITFWSSSGSPGKTTLASSVAAELCLQGKKVFLVDADTYSPSLDVLLALNDHPAGLAAACRLVAQQRFDLEQLLRLSVQLDISGNELTIMTGLSSASRWPEISKEKFEKFIEIAQEHFDFVLLDVASEIQANIVDAGLFQERNCITRWALERSDQVLAICGSDPVSISRYLEAGSSLIEIGMSGTLLTIVNRLRLSVLGASAKQQISETLFRLGQVQVAAFVPDDQSAADAAIRASIPLSLGRRGSSARQAISLFVKTQILSDLNKLDRSMQKSRVAKLI